MKKLLALLFIGLFAVTFDVSAQTSTTTTAALDTVAAKSYVGKYKMKDSPFEEIIVSLKDGKLAGEAVGQGSAELAPTKETDIFEVVGYDGKVEFVRDESKLVKKIKLTMQGSTMEGDKQP
ncbi:hypothetical protein [Emticicia sp. BO119]|uniref:hypothetical protein n=1 Tax=Emticicia sp. BO119 TaxID=2757768 RepID=UPI0015F0572B|nr:hypothetical protein [Emticicia sp. BO119]MBA4851234.1 hypothetical protein [Emticicia sp. BO119]